MHGAVGKITLPRQKIQENTIAFISGVLTLTLTLTLHPNPNPDPDPDPNPNPNPNPNPDPDPNQVCWRRAHSAFGTRRPTASI